MMINNVMLFLRRFLAASLLLSSVVPGGAQATEELSGDELIARLRQLVEIEPQVSGSFVQEKTLSVLPQPLRSRGEFFYSADSGLRWVTLAPIKSELAFDRRGIAQTVDGETLWVIDGEQPLTVALTQVLTGMLSADWDVLQNYFTLQGEINEERWSVTLLPKDYTWSRVVEKMQVQGGQDVETIEMWEPNQDRTNISLSVDNSQ